MGIEDPISYLQNFPIKMIICYIYIVLCHAIFYYVYVYVRAYALRTLMLILLLLLLLCSDVRQRTRVGLES